MLQVFIPCKDESTRLPKKNFLPFGNSATLLEHKLRQVIRISREMRITVSGGNRAAEVVVDFEKLSGREINFVEQPENLTGDELVKHCAEVYRGFLPHTTILWTQVTNPLFDRYEEALARYDFVNGEINGLVAVTPVRSFVVDADFCPANYAGNWPKTQDIEPMYVINSALFITSRGQMTQGNKFGWMPHAFEVDEFEGLDIDWQYQYDAARRLCP